jgi:hypothetical protein
MQRGQVRPCSTLLDVTRPEKFRRTLGLIRNRLDSYPILLTPKWIEIEPKQIRPGLKNNSLIVLLAFSRISEAIRLSRARQGGGLPAREFGKCEQRFYIPVATTCQRNPRKKKDAQRVAD